MPVRNLVAAAVTSLVLSAGVGTAPAGAQQAAYLASDSSFIQTVGSLGLLQAKLGKFAEKKGSSPAVVEFGKRMMADYARANDELAAAAKQAAYPSPVLLREHEKIADRFSRKGRSSFDQDYMAEVVKRQGEMVRLFQHEAESGRVLSLKRLASRMLPDMQERLTLATQTGSSVGADVTASAEAPRGSGNQ